MDSSAPHKPNLKTEAIAGITTFFTMAYIVIVNPVLALVSIGLLILERVKFN
jgi:xanthine/uracil/vitamin C permease (AzgA family)